VLKELSGSLGPHLLLVPDGLHEAIGVVCWWQETGDRWNLPGVVLDVRVVEWVAALVGTDSWLARPDEEAAAFGRVYHDHRRLFCHPDGRPLHPDTITGS